MEKLVIHISGPTILKYGLFGTFAVGYKINEKFKDKIIIEDLSNLRRKFIKKKYGKRKLNTITKDTFRPYDKKNVTEIDENEYQKYIDKYIKNETKPIIFIGDNRYEIKGKPFYHNLHSQYNYYVEGDDFDLVEEYCELFMFYIFSMSIKNIKETKKTKKIHDKKHVAKYFENVIQTSSRNMLKSTFNPTEIIKNNDERTKEYDKQNYKLISSSHINKSIISIVNKYIKIHGPQENHERKNA